ncbi:MAG: hypothetical protein AAGC57_18485 [Pseudomonadota bacterium]
MYETRFRNGYSPFSLARRLLEPPFAERQKFLFQHLPYVRAYSDAVLALRDGDLMASLLVEGLNAETEAADRLEQTTLTLARMIQQFQGAVTITVNRITAEDRPNIQASGTDDFAGALDRAWRNHLTSGGLKRQQLMVTATIRRPPHEKILAFGKDDPAALAAERDRLAHNLEAIMRDLASALSAARPQRLTLSSGRWLGLIASLLDGIYHPIRPQADHLPVATMLPEHEVWFKGPKVLIGAGEARQRQAVVLSLKSYPGITWTGMFDGLELPVDIVTTQSFSPIDTTLALERIKRTRRQMIAGEDDAGSLAEGLVSAADDVASGRAVFGHHQMSMVLFSEDETALEHAVSAVRRAGQQGGGTVVRETFCAPSIFFAQHPGNQSYRARQAIVSALNFAEMTALHVRPTGRRDGSSPWGAPITWLPTTGSEVFAVNLHERSRGPEDLTPGHTLILGRTGTGKSVLAAFLIAQARRFGTRTFVFDKDRGLEMPLRALGARYTAVRTGEPTGLNPLLSETDARGIGWLPGWIAMLAGRTGDLDAAQMAAISTAVRENAKAPEGLRRFTQFREFFRSLTDGRDLHERLGEWCAGGRYGWVFDGEGAARDPFADAADIMAFDVTELFDDQAVRTAWLAYVFRRIERLVEDGRPTLIVLDEAWKLLDDPYFVRTIKDWLLTMRKKNAVVMMLTQLPSHLSDSAAGTSIIESAVTQFLFPNFQARPEDYRQFALTDGELDQILDDPPGRHVLHRSGGTRVMLDLDLAPLGDLLGVLAGASPTRTATPDWQTNPDFWRKFSS